MTVWQCFASRGKTAPVKARSHTPENKPNSSIGAVSDGREAQTSHLEPAVALVTGVTLKFLEDTLTQRVAVTESVFNQPSTDEKQDRTIYKVVVNHEEQYSIWPADRENALGWKDAALDPLPR